VAEAISSARAIAAFIRQSTSMAKHDLAIFAGHSAGQLLSTADTDTDMVREEMSQAKIAIIKETFSRHYPELMDAAKARVLVDLAYSKAGIDIINFEQASALESMGETVVEHFFEDKNRPQDAQDLHQLIEVTSKKVGNEKLTDEKIVAKAAMLVTRDKTLFLPKITETARDMKAQGAFKDKPYAQALIDIYVRGAEKHLPEQHSQPSAMPHLPHKHVQKPQV